jgi:Neuraminidase (sialidase)
MLAVSVSVLALSVPTAFAQVNEAPKSNAGASLLTTVTKNSPFAGCGYGGPGTNYTNAEVEPWVDVNPTNPQNIVGAWQQDRWSNGGAHGLAAGYSNDGGKTWNTTPLPFTKCAPGGLAYERASDPWVSFGPDGTLYTIAITFNQSNNDNAVATATSFDGGKSWSNVSVLQAEQNWQYFNDKESITADPVKAGTAYAIWDRLISPTDNPQAVLHAYAYSGPTLFSKTTDYGKTWSKPQVIVDTAQNNQTIGNQIVVDPKTGTLYNFFNLIISTGPNKNDTHGNNVAFNKSTDGGLTWSKPQIIAKLGVVDVTDPNTGDGLRTGDIIPEPAIDPATGRLYVVWQEAGFSGGTHSDIAISSSPDGGATWSAPAKVNAAGGKQAFNPSVRVNASGTVAVTYYDFRSLTNETATLPTDYWFVSSKDGGQTWGGETRLAGGFDMKSAPYAGGYFIGDYQGLASYDDTFYPFFVGANSGNAANPTDVFMTTVTP